MMTDREESQVIESKVSALFWLVLSTFRLYLFYLEESRGTQNRTHRIQCAIVVREQIGMPTKQNCHDSKVLSCKFHEREHLRLCNFVP